MSYYRFTNLALERPGCAGGAQIPGGKPNHTSHPALYVPGGERGGACPSFTMYVHVALSTCNPDSSAAALWGLREADKSHILHLRVLQHPQP